jgi:DNA-binding CsgD family transcriptional regulator
MLEISTDPKDWENIKVPRIVGDRKRPVLLSGFALPHPKGIEDTRILILIEEIGRRRERSAEHAKDYYKLTAREQAVIYRLLEGMTNKEIAKELGIAEQTTKDHIENIMKKMKVSTRTGILAKIFCPDCDSDF